MEFLAGLGLSRDVMVGKVMAKNPFLMGYSVENRLKPTAEFLKNSVGLTESGVQAVAVSHPEVLCRDAEKTLRPNFEYLCGAGFEGGQIARLVAGYPPILIKSVENSLRPRIKFLVEVMGREIGEVAEFPDFFRYGLKKRLASRHNVLKEN